LGSRTGFIFLTGKAPKGQEASRYNQVVAVHDFTKDPIRKAKYKWVPDNSRKVLVERKN
jgi:hypothetical protein